MRCTSLTWSLPPALKKPFVNSSTNARRSFLTPPWNCPTVASSKAPSGLSCDLKRYGGTAGPKDRLRTPAGAVLGDVARHFAAAHREADERGALDVELLQQGIEIRGERVVL